ncbi:MAG: hypothetical protein FJZ90_02280 [Chloroflexi bacterium]|nr:hypothetical protein [Chloroflexota bacterium]
MDTAFFLPTDVGTFTQVLNEILDELPEHVYPLKKGFIIPGRRAWPRETKNVDPKRRSTMLEVDASYSIWKGTDKVRFFPLPNVIAFRVTPRTGAKMGITVQAQCNPKYPVLADYFREVLAEIAERWPEVDKKAKSLGTQGGTMDRVKSARDLVEGGTPKTEACKRAHIDPRTYDRYVEQFVDWGD